MKTVMTTLVHTLFLIFLTTSAFAAESVFSNLITDNANTGRDFYKESYTISQKKSRAPASTDEKTEYLDLKISDEFKFYYYLDNLAGCFIKKFETNSFSNTSVDKFKNIFIEAKKLNNSNYFVFKFENHSYITPLACLVEANAPSL